MNAASQTRDARGSLRPDATSSAHACDREWFAQHPSRATYVRAVLRDEFADATEDWLVVVRKLSGGDFARAYFPCPVDMADRTGRVFALVLDEMFERISGPSGSA